MVRYLEKSEYGKCRPLWEEAFPEDSKSFADYYFSEKLPGSKVLAIEGGKLLTMAHLNPYTISTGHFSLLLSMTSRYGSLRMNRKKIWKRFL